MCLGDGEDAAKLATDRVFFIEKRRDAFLLLVGHRFLRAPRKKRCLATYENVLSSAVGLMEVTVVAVLRRRLVHTILRVLHRSEVLLRGKHPQTSAHCLPSSHLG